MFGNRKKIRTTKIDTLVGRRSEMLGDVKFAGGLHVDGTIKGNVAAEEDPSSVLTLSETGTIEGEVRVPNVVLNGTVIVDVHARQHLELASNARVTGNVYHSLTALAMAVNRLKDTEAESKVVILLTDGQNNRGELSPETAAEVAKTIGVRVPDNNIVRAMLLELGQPIMSSTLIPPGASEALDDAVEIRERYEHQVDLVIDGGFCGVEPTTVISLIDESPEVLRHGRGDVSFLEE